MSEAPERPGLAGLQGWMQGVLLGPEGVGDPLAIARHLTPSAALSATGRLAIYQRGVRLRLLETLRGMLPIFRATVGQESFDHFALDYLERYPPRSYTLARLADDFPAYLDVTRPALDDPDHPRARWSAFLVELATLELLLLEIYDGPGLEGRSIPDAAAVAAVPFAAFGALRPVPAPCSRRLALEFPVHRHLSSMRRRASPSVPIPDPEPTWLAVTRWDYRVMLHPLEPRQHALLGVLDGTRDLDGAVRDLALVPGEEPLTRGLVRRWLIDWVEQGFFADLSRSDIAPAAR